MPVVVSANYRDRSQKNWLIRQRGDSLEKFELRERVAVKDFKFCESFSGEAGFGCNTVAVGELEEREIDREQLVRIRFTGLRFEEQESGTRVDRGSVLVLDETGMYYLPA